MKLTVSQIELNQRQIPDWKLNAKGEIEKMFVFKGFPQAVLFVNAVALLAEGKNHHPDILIQWNRVTLALSTHDVEGLSELDFELAKQINTLPVLT